MTISSHTKRYFMRIPMGVIMRASMTTEKSVNVSLAPELLEEARKQNINLSARYPKHYRKSFAKTNGIPG